MHTYNRTSGESPSRATYRAVAETKGCDPLELPPIAHSVEADAMDSFVANSMAVTDFRTAFEYAGCKVILTTNRVRVASRNGNT